MPVVVDNPVIIDRPINLGFKIGIGIFLANILMGAVLAAVVWFFWGYVYPHVKQQIEVVRTYQQERRLEEWKKR